MANEPTVQETIVSALAGGDGKDGNPEDWREVADEIVEAIVSAGHWWCNGCGKSLGPLHPTKHLQHQDAFDGRPL